jgi:hypothetical protein
VDVFGQVPRIFTRSFSFNLCSGICQRQHTVQILVFWGHLYSLLRGMDPDPSISKQNSKKNLNLYCFVTAL